MAAQHKRNKEQLTIIWVSVGSDPHEGGGQEQQHHSSNARRHACSSCSWSTSPRACLHHCNIHFVLENPKEEGDGKKKYTPFCSLLSIYRTKHTDTVCVGVLYIYVVNKRGGGEKKDLKRVFHKQNQNKASRLSEFLAYLTFFFNEIANIVSASKMIKITSQ